ncbi:MAG: hypothetical protein E6R07_05075 [Nevskiaceae bacterium]|nr:MAG: hypothetical protein E6R07_05075 [Nevskiaceae bacterium]
MSAPNAYGYPGPIWARFSAPTHVGDLDRPQGRLLLVEVGSPSAKSLLRLQLDLVDGGVAAARFKAYGCPTTIAVGEWLAAWLEHNTVARWPDLHAMQIREALEIPDDRAHCALMGEDAVRALHQQVAA